MLLLIITAMILLLWLIGEYQPEVEIKLSTKKSRENLTTQIWSEFEITKL